MVCVGSRNGGFTVLEVLVVLVVLSVLVAAAMVSHSQVVSHARGLEAETALAEINRLETLYHTNHAAYSGDLAAIGFNPVPRLKYYTVEVRVDDGGASFHAAAIPLSGERTELALVLTHTRGRTTLQKRDVRTLARQSQDLNPLSGMSSRAEGQVQMSIGTQRKSQQEDCRKGGEATVAADGLLDMNFCLK
ncbi:MAG: prepilin-type N-terminal cleavage/methylation domain-containing protein [Nitrospira sp.]|nr:prepilin-type N-terminal cleavage/methylation domain-containing protein [Nitrospira sp.]MDH5192985.1 prepilin-type N-terminal cleavage/methylation domain-containing protein [Nitrospira sp.]